MIFQGLFIPASGLQFERLLKSYFEFVGYQVEMTPASSDYGADLILQTETSRDLIVVQAKFYSGGKIGVKAIQEVIGAEAHYSASQGWVITNSGFTDNALTLANDAGIRCISGGELNWLLSSDLDSVRESLGYASRGSTALFKFYSSQIDEGASSNQTVSPWYVPANAEDEQRLEDFVVDLIGIAKEKVSPSFVQRQLNIPFSRAKEILGSLETTIPASQKMVEKSGSLRLKVN